MHEEISQLIDQELNPEQRSALLERLINTDTRNNDTARKSWKCYHLIGNVIRDEVPSTGKDLSALVRDKLEKEPTVLAPLSIKKPGSNERQNARQNARKDVWKSVGLFAIAASLVVVAVATLMPMKFDGIAFQLTASSKAFNTSQAIRFSQEFDEMLVKHAEFTASPGMNGLIAYAKLVSAEKLQQ